MADSPTLDVAAPAAQIVAPDTGADNKPDKFEVPQGVSTLLRNLGMVDGEAAPGGEPEKPKPDAKPKDEKPKPAGDGTPPKPGDALPDKPIGVRKEKLVRPELPVAELPKPKLPTPEPTEYKPDAAWEGALEENEREILDDAREAERLFPDRYKGLTARTAKFIRDHADLTAKEEFDDQDPKYKAWLDTNQPKLSRKEIREIETARATTSVKQEFDGKLTDMRHQLFVRDHEPKIQEEGRTVFAELTNTALPEELVKAIKADGFEKAKEVYGLEIETAQNVISIATDDLIEFRRITVKDPETGRTLQPILDKPPTGDPEDPAFQREMARFQAHKRLGQLVDFLCDDFKTKAPAEQQVRNGRWYVTRDEMQRIKPEQRHRFWTFTNLELIDLAKKNVPASVKEAISRRQDQMKRLGWSRPAPKAAAPPKPADEPPPKPTDTPRTPSPSPVPGGGDVTAEVDARAKRLAAQLGRE